MATKNKQEEVKYSMPTEVSDWISNANSRINYLTAKVERLTLENQALRQANKVLEQRFMSGKDE